MSFEPAIVVRGLGKHYDIQHREPVAGRRRMRTTRERVWAMKDVSFDIGRGEVVGIVGRNGAGKSTLLKLLSRITEPSTGQVALWGRVGSLLEVGTGFHPELTGRENVFLNGSVLGMSRSEITRQFDDIVAFAGVERYLDTPVKRYSSGMYVRLAFSVAIHLKPEVLIVDEVLAVGDGDFQRRCLAKMNEVARGGRTVLLVSHNMGSIRSLCQRVLYFRAGELVLDGPPEPTIAQYLEDLSSSGGSPDDNADDREGDGRLRLETVRLLGRDGRELTKVMGGDDLVVEMPYEVHDPSVVGKQVTVLLNVYNDSGVVVTAAHTRLTRPDLLPAGSRGVLRCTFDRLPLTMGEYRIAIALHLDGETADYLPRAAEFDVAASVFYPTGVALDDRAAAFHSSHAWSHDADASPVESQSFAHA